MTSPNDPRHERDLDRYLKGDSTLSRRYRDASGEGAPPELDEAILARARAELKRKPPSLNRVLAPFALAASVVLGVNLAWNLWQVEPAKPVSVLEQAKPQSRDDAFVPEPPAPAPAPASAEAERQQYAEALARQREVDALQKRKAEESRAEERKLAARSARPAEAPPAAPPAAASAPEAQSFAAESMAGAAAAPQPQALADAAAPMSEAQKIDRLIGYVGGLQGATFLRNGKEYGPAEAAKHMQLKREKAGDRCDDAAEFIRTCASFSSMSGEAYLIRFADGRTRTAEDVLREELARLENR